MNCKNCGIPLTPGDKFCKNCGAPVVSEPVQQPMMEQPTQTPPIMNEQPVNIPPIMDQTVQQPRNNQPYDNMPKKNKNPLVVIMIIILVLGGIVGGYFGIKYVLNNVANFLHKAAEETTEDVVYKGYNFKIPLLYEHEEANEGNSLSVYSEEEEWGFALVVVEDFGEVEDFEGNEEELEYLLNEMYGDVTELIIQTIDGIKMITCEVVLDSYNTILTISDLELDEGLFIAIFNMDNEFDYSLIEKVTPIIESATAIY